MIGNAEKDMEILAKENEILLRQVLFLQEKLEQAYSENNLLKVNEKTYYGSAERVKHALSYRFGNVMVKNSKSFKGVVTMPYALFREVKLYRRGNEEILKRALPRLEEYSDYAMALRVKKHLSYRLGEVVVNNLSSIRKWPVMIKGILHIARNK